MKKSELILSIAKRHPFLKTSQVAKIIDVIFDEISTGLQNGKRVEIRGLGAFSVRQRKIQLSFPSGSQAQISFGTKNIVYFRIGKSFFDRLNANNES